MREDVPHSLTLVVLQLFLRTTNTNTSPSYMVGCSVFYFLGHYSQSEIVPILQCIEQWIVETMKTPLSTADALEIRLGEVKTNKTWSMPYEYLLQFLQRAVVLEWQIQLSRFCHTSGLWDNHLRIYQQRTGTKCWIFLQMTRMLPIFIDKCFLAPCQN
jgi:hypothetical protein